MAPRAVRGEQYDGSRWELHKSYEAEKDVHKTLAVLEGREFERGIMSGPTASRGGNNACRYAV